MQTVRLISIFLIAASLMGCNHERIAELTSENRALQEKLAQYDQKTQLELAKKENAASVFNACNEFYGLGSGFCPEKVYEDGSKAVAQGFAGVGWVFWSVIFSKMVIFAGLIIFLTMGLWSVVKKRIMPDFDELEASQKLIKDAQKRADDAIIEEQKTRQRIKELSHELERINHIHSSYKKELYDMEEKKNLMTAQASAKSVFDDL